ncbi:MAG: hypothetical protein IJT70_00960 [Clostridia bacterium]|nr:hypothetical protein [Clostridia bacterium]
MSKRTLCGVLAVLLITVLSLILASCGDESGKPEDTNVQVTESESIDTEKPSTASIEDIVDENGNIIGKNYYDAEGIRVSSELYDSEGRTVMHTTYNADGTESTSTSYTFLGGNTPYQYEIARYEYENGKVSQITSTVYHLDGLPESAVITDGDNKQIEAFFYEYDDNGNLIKETHANDKHYYDEITEYVYGYYGEIAKVLYKDGSGELMSYTEYTYNADDNVEKELNYSAEGEMTSYVEYVYDESGSFVETREYVPDEEGNFILFD